MKIILHILRKEFKQVFRNRSMLPILFIMPFIQLLILSFAATFEIKNIELFVVDMDKSEFSRDLIGKFQASEYYNLVGYSSDIDAGQNSLMDGKADMFLTIPQNFERDLTREKKTEVLLAIDAIDGAAAGVELAYSISILSDYNLSIQTALPDFNLAGRGERINVMTSYWYNEEMDYKTFMVPGILVVLVTMIAAFLAGMNIVREKEIGTLEQINVSPIRKHQFIIGKLLPFWIIALVDLAVGLVFAKIVFNIPIVGSIELIFLFAATYLFVVLGIGLFISTITETQQQAMFIAWFFLVIFILMSGLFTPIESMPQWAQRITDFNPVRYFIEVMRMVMLKGSAWSDISGHYLTIALSAVIINGLAVLNYRKTA